MDSVIKNPNELMTVSEVARALVVSEQTVRTYEARRILRAARLTNGTRLFDREDVERLKAQRGRK
jgi:excisionase family DNA binding protein